MAEPPAQPVTFAEATPADLDVLLTFMAALRAEDPFPASAVDENATRVAIEKLLANPALGRAWAIRSGGQPAGYVVLTLGYSIEMGGRTAFVDELYVAPAHRGRGLGRRTLAFVADAARSIGVRSLLLEVSPSNEAARRLYRSAGFVERTYRLMVVRFDAGH